MITVSHELLSRQIATIFASWGMPQEHIDTTVGLMVEADLRGIDSHGIGMLQTYDTNRKTGRMKLHPDIRVTRDLPVLTLIDADHSIGHVPARMGMEIAIAKCHEHGVAASVVRNSNHFGAAGVYSTMAVERGLIGMATTGTTQRSVVPTFAREPMFSTNPIAFAAPTRRNQPFSLDMATSTVAVGKLQIARRAGKPLPVGWSVKPDGSPETNAQAAVDATPKRLTPLGGTRELGSHKGYGLAMMVEILSSLLGGSFMGGHDLATGKRGDFINVGHFFLAIDPGFFRGDLDTFADDLDGLIDLLHATPPADPGQKVLIPGEPEHTSKLERAKHGIPMTPKLVEEVRDVCAGCGADFMLGD
jgi:LDH2 family malate/lactate/ureidoglycolate dehydrogenase